MLKTEIQPYCATLHRSPDKGTRAEICRLVKLLQEEFGPGLVTPLAAELDPSLYLSALKLLLADLHPELRLKNSPVLAAARLIKNKQQQPPPVDAPIQALFDQVRKLVTAAGKTMPNLTENFDPELVVLALEAILDNPPYFLGTRQPFFTAYSTVAVKKRRAKESWKKQVKKGVEKLPTTTTELPAGTTSLGHQAPDSSPPTKNAPPPPLVSLRTTPRQTSETICQLREAAVRKLELQEEHRKTRAQIANDLAFPNLAGTVALKHKDVRRLTIDVGPTRLQIEFNEQDLSPWVFVRGVAYEDLPLSLDPKGVARESDPCLVLTVLDAFIRGRHRLQATRVESWIPAPYFLDFGIVRQALAAILGPINATALFIDRSPQEEIERTILGGPKSMPFLHSFLRLTTVPSELVELIVSYTKFAQIFHRATTLRQPPSYPQSDPLAFLQPLVQQIVTTDSTILKEMLPLAEKLTHLPVSNWREDGQFQSLWLAHQQEMKRLVSLFTLQLADYFDQQLSELRQAWLVLPPEDPKLKGDDDQQTWERVHDGQRLDGQRLDGQILGRIGLAPPQRKTHPDAACNLSCPWCSPEHLNLEDSNEQKAHPIVIEDQDGVWTTTGMSLAALLESLKTQQQCTIIEIVVTGGSRKFQIEQLEPLQDSKQRSEILFPQIQAAKAPVIGEPLRHLTETLTDLQAVGEVVARFLELCANDPQPPTIKTRLNTSAVPNPSENLQKLAQELTKFWQAATKYLSTVAISINYVDQDRFTKKLKPRENESGKGPQAFARREACIDSLLAVLIDHYQKTQTIPTCLVFTRLERVSSSRQEIMDYLLKKLRQSFSDDQELLNFLSTMFELEASQEQSKPGNIDQQIRDIISQHMIIDRQLVLPDKDTAK
ncbi:MAG: hypothetical protein GF390_02995 [Candidatus Pacebacteria bacterium]|nr:hypothetical protein [Candidatus Paceibacterota bacterium]